MIVTDKNIICFPTLPWNHNWERQHEIIYFLASITTGKVIVHQPYGMINHNVKTIFQKFKSLSKSLEKTGENQNNPTRANMVFVQTKFVPRHHNKRVDRFNQRLIEKAMPVNFEDSIVYVTYVNSFTFHLFKTGGIKIFDLAACRQTLHELSEDFKLLEKEAVKSADVIFVDNIMTIKDYQSLNKNMFHLPQGINPERFKNDDEEGLLSWRKGFDKVVGYSGSDIVMDYELLEGLIIENKNTLFLFVGDLPRVESQQLLRFKNVRFTGRVHFNDLGKYYVLFDVGLIPYLLNDRTSGVFPTKLFEYLAAGIPVISTALPDLLTYNEPFIYIVEKENASQKLSIALKAEVDDVVLENFVGENTWQSRFDFIIEKINPAL